jgi:hypothetical protein
MDLVCSDSNVRHHSLSRDRKLIGYREAPEHVRRNFKASAGRMIARFTPRLTRALQDDPDIVATMPSDIDANGYIVFHTYLNKYHHRDKANPETDCWHPHHYISRARAESFVIHCSPPRLGNGTLYQARSGRRQLQCIPRPDFLHRQRQQRHARRWREQ